MLLAIRGLWIVVGLLGLSLLLLTPRPADVTLHLEGGERGLRATADELHARTMYRLLDPGGHDRLASALTPPAARASNAEPLEWVVPQHVDQIRQTRRAAIAGLALALSGAVLGLLLVGRRSRSAVWYLAFALPGCALVPLVLTWASPLALGAIGYTLGVFATNFWSARTAWGITP